MHKVVRFLQLTFVYGRKLLIKLVGIHCMVYLKIFSMVTFMDLVDNVSSLMFTKRWKVSRDKVCTRLSTGPNFIELVSTKICSAGNFFLDKNKITNQISTWFSGLANNSWIPVKSNMQQTENWLVILFLSRKKCHAKQTFVLSSSMKLGPDHCIGRSF